MKRRILVVEDERGMRVALTDRLSDEGYLVETAETGDEGFARAKHEPFDLLLLDVRLPGKNGFDVCRDLRRDGVTTPILMLTAKGQIVDRVLGLKLGADDYLVKPFDPLELLARVEALLRRVPAAAAPPSPDVYQFESVRIDFRRAEVERDGRVITLLPLEYKLLCYFVSHRTQALTRDRLLDEVWGYDATPSSRTVDVHVAGLRQKLEPDPTHPKYLLTIHGLGYKFVG
jgi:two-component system alkaline phosphatase synthesis response regulator PhoP